MTSDHEAALLGALQRIASALERIAAFIKNIRDKEKD